MIEDKATEKLKKRLQDMGLIVNAGAGNANSPKSVSVGTEKHAASPMSASNGISHTKKRGKK